MLLRFVSCAIAGLGVLAAGCTEEVISPVYDTCFSIQDCVPAAQICEELAVDFAGEVYSNAICTLFCEVEGPVSPDCPRSFLGLDGSCYPSNVGGGPDDALICFEPCRSSGDCLFGFRCLGAAELCPNDPDCPIVDDDRICVPGPR